MIQPVHLYNYFYNKTPTRYTNHFMFNNGEFGTGWSVKKRKLQMSLNCKRFRCNQTRKNKKMPQDQRLKQRPIDIPFKVWKELVKSYEKLDAQRKASNESIQVLNFSLNII